MTWSFWTAAAGKPSVRPLEDLTDLEAAPWTDRAPPGGLGATGSRGGGDRLGWVDLPLTASRELPEYVRLRDALLAEGFERLVVVAMGGSGSCPAALVRGLPRRRGLDTRFLNTLAPEALRDAVHPERLPGTVFLVASKSGTTVETRTLEAVIVQAVKDRGLGPGRQLLALSDPGSPLLRRAEASGYRGRFEGRPSVGGRFSALDAFGLLPAVLAGCELEDGLGAVRETRESLDSPAPSGAETAFRLGALLARLGTRGRFQAHLSASSDRAMLLPWLEQLFAENTGKQGTGILPVILPPPPRPESAGPGVFRIHLGAAEGEEEGWLDAGVRAGVPLIHCRPAPGGFLEEVFRWQIATAVAAHRLEVNPYDQPDVEGAKAAANRLAENPASAPEPERVGDRELREFLGSSPAGGLAINAFGHRSPSAEASLRTLQRRIAERFRVTPAIGFGSALLHSLGQIEKGGPPDLAVLMLTWDPEADVPIPGSPELPPALSGLGTGAFARLQAAADYEELKRRGRRVLWLDAAAPGEAGLAGLAARIASAQSP